MPDPLDVAANWAAIVSAVQQLPSTIVGMRKLLGGASNKDAKELVDKLRQDFSMLTDGLRVLEELKTFHDDCQVVHNRFQRIHSDIIGQPRNSVDLPQVAKTWREVKTYDLTRFVARVKGFKYIRPSIPQDEFRLLQEWMERFEIAVKRGKVLALQECADELLQTLTSILTRADTALKRAIGDLHESVLKNR